MDTTMRELDTTELEAIAGGYDDGDWCGTHPPGWHPPVVHHT